jgi:uncharacterized protein (TIGR03083 family)
MGMAPDEQLTVIDEEGRRLIDVARRDPDLVVPQYPTWTLRDLVVHVASVHGRVTTVCQSLPVERVPAAERPPGTDPFDWAAVTLAQMLEALGTADLNNEVWTLIEDKRLGFWVRRMVIETGLHRWDAESAFGPPQPLRSTMATQGLDEFSEMFLARLGDVPTVEFEATDLDLVWRYGDGSPTATIEGTASDLFLRLMSRPGVSLTPEWEAAVDALGSPAE